MLVKLSGAAALLAVGFAAGSLVVKWSSNREEGGCRDEKLLKALGARLAAARERETQQDHTIAKLEVALNHMEKAQEELRRELEQALAQVQEADDHNIDTHFHTPDRPAKRS